MSDKREDILSLMQTLLEAVPGVRGVWRDRGVITKQMTPAILLLDGNERRLSVFKASSGVQMPPAVFQVKPQVAIVLPPRDVLNNLTLNGQSLAIGPSLSAYRTLIVSTILDSQDLVNLVSPTGQIAYDGYDTDMRTGDEIGAFGPFMVFNFSINYSMDPAQLASPASIAIAQAQIAAIWP